MYSHTIHSIGVIHTPYQQKFGIARQPGLVPAASAILVLYEDYSADYLRGLEAFDYVWLSFIFHDAIAEGYAPLVRPPRLGGKKKMGVFATRSPHRPNHLGLSLCRLESVDAAKRTLYLSGTDLLNNTPIIDIKPYLPFVEAKPHARAGFAPEPPKPLHTIWQITPPPELSDSMRLLIEQTLAQDPRPAYQHNPERRYAMSLANWHIGFTIDGQSAYIVELKPMD